MNAEANYNDEVLMEVRNLKKWFPVNRGLFNNNKSYVKAVDDINLTIRRGETLGIVGESGCGKSTLARVVMRLIPPTEGEVIFGGKDIAKISPRELIKIRRDMQMIFQDPYASLNPRMRVKDILCEPFIIHKVAAKGEAFKKAEELLDMVGMNRNSMGKFPHEFSGGQRQRICIARALAVNPKMIICDECVSALDVSIQAQIINLLVKLQKQLGLTVIFISHDLRVVQHISTSVAVMYLGKIVENASVTEIFGNPIHPYTKALISAVPVTDSNAKKNRIILTGDIPSPINVPAGCSFSTRCYMAREECQTESPVLRAVAEGHFCRCMLQS
jgi:peptide/nickel transport system ATP-binding protein/oligopeptide transport system ATP-binding protein